MNWNLTPIFIAATRTVLVAWKVRTPAAQTTATPAVTVMAEAAGMVAAGVAIRLKFFGRYEINSGLCRCNKRLVPVLLEMAGFFRCAVGTSIARMVRHRRIGLHLLYPLFAFCVMR